MVKLMQPCVRSMCPIYVWSNPGPALKNGITEYVFENVLTHFQMKISFPVLMLINAVIHLFKSQPAVNFYF